MFVLLAALAAGLFLLAHTAPFPFVLDALWHQDVVWRMPPSPDGPRVYLTFDDGPNPAATPAILDILQREGGTATFFVIDQHITEDTVPVLRRIVEEGHDVALHSGERALAFHAPADLEATLQATAARIEAVTGHPPCRAFRPHAGIRSGHLLETLDRLDYVMVGWGWNLWDWNWFRRRTPATVVPRLVAHASDGDIIVIHDGDHRALRSDRSHSVATVARLVPALHDRGFELGRVCDGLKLDPRHQRTSD